MADWARALVIGGGVLLASWALLVVLAARLPDGALKGLAGLLPNCVQTARALRRNPAVPRRGARALDLAGDPAAARAAAARGARRRPTRGGARGGAAGGARGLSGLGGLGSRRSRPRRLRAGRSAGRGRAPALVADVAHVGAVVVTTGTYDERHRDESCEESMTEHVPLLRWICRLAEADPTASVRSSYQFVVGSP